jgi:hypothetical protein
MSSPKQTKNGCGSDQVLEAEGVAISVQSCPVGSEGGVGKPGGFTNTSDDPRAGGAVVLPGGITNTSMSEETVETTDPDEEADYISRVRSSGP